MAAPRDRQQWTIGDVLDRTDLADLLDELAGPARRAGPGRRWHCPVADHDDVHASVTMFRDRHGHERWRCWSADHRGDAVDLAAIARRSDRPEAIDWLAERAGMVPDRPLPPAATRSASPDIAAVGVMSPLVDRYVAACERVLRSAAAEPTRDWLHARGFDDATIRANRLGADPGRSMMTRSRGLPNGAGPAAVFPCFDIAGALTYVQARYLDADTAGRKYDNPAAALAAHPRLAFPTPTGQRSGVLLVCEGLPDALTASQAGFRAVGLLGAQSPDASVAARLANHADNLGLDIAVACDPDPAGRRVGDLLTELLADHGHHATVITPPNGLDLNDWSLTDPTWATTLDATVGVSVEGISGVEL